MKRCGIFVFFDKQGLVGDYIITLLKSLDDVINKLIIVINGEIQIDERMKLYEYTESVYQRDNVGFDGGAYKDAFLHFLDNEELTKWDEILLLNDTFYGPFFPWKDIFTLMCERACDFWGLSGHPGGVEEFLDGEIVSAHIQSYFIVIKRRMFLNPAFYKFWAELEYPESYKDAVRNFEIYFSEYFTKLGFQYDSWIEVQKERLNKSDFQTTYNIETQITKLHFPVLKRKKYMLQYYLQLKKTFQYIDISTLYPLENILADIYQRSINGEIRPYNPEQIIKFCDKYSEIYLFGKGEYAENIEQYLSDNGIVIAGNIVSKKEREINQRLFEIEEFEVKPWNGIIVALNQKHLMEVEEKIRKNIPFKQLIFPIYD